MKIHSLDSFASNKFYRIEISTESGTFKPIFIYMLNFVTHGPCTAISENGVICFHIKDVRHLIPTPYYDYKSYWNKKACDFVDYWQNEACKKETKNFD